MFELMSDNLKAELWQIAGEETFRKTIVDF